eukprot:scaffold12619_cov107-Cylindrotheca_fusiformis.AAC.3
MLPLYFDPVADGVSIDIQGLVGRENEPIEMTVSITTKDIDSSERIGKNAYIRLCDNATLVGSYDRVVTGDEDAVVDGMSVVGYYRVPGIESLALSMQPDQYWHGSCDVTLVAYSIESEDDEDADHLKANKETFTARFAAVATPPLITAPAQVSGDEDTSIFLPGLSAALVDTVVANGYESLSVVFTNVPDDSSFNHGLNAGSGRWSIPVEKLSLLLYTPPPHFSGTVSLIFEAISRELDGGDEASSTSDIQVDVVPVADDFLIVAKNVALGNSDGDAILLDLNIRLFDEDEMITLTFGSVPAGIALRATNGGSVIYNEDDTWTFSGSSSSANALEFLVSGSGVPDDVFLISISGYTTDGSVSLEPAKTDSFTLTVQSNSRLLQSFDEVNIIKAPNLPGNRNCGSEVLSLWDSSSGSIQFPMGSISVDTQQHSSVAYSLSHTKFDTDVSINWFAVVYPDNPQGYTMCPVEVFSEGSELLLTGNCYDYRSEAYVLYNIQGSDSALATVGDIAVPTDCEVPDGVETGTTIAFKISVPCSACSDDLSSLPSPNANRRVLNGSASKSRYSNQILDSIHRRSNRKLQDDELLSSDVKMEVFVAGDDVAASSSSPVCSACSVAVASFCLAAALTLY